MKIVLDPSLRPNPVLQDPALLRNATLQRAADIVLPFLNLHAGTSRLLSIGCGAGKTWTQLSETKRCLEVHNYKGAALSSVASATSLLCTGLVIAAPLGGAMVSFAIRLGGHVQHLVIHLTKKQYAECGKELLRTMQTALYLSSLFFGNPALIFLSIAAQAAQEFSSGVVSLRKEELPEAIANFLLCAVRLHAARPHYSRARRHYFGKELTQADAARLFEKSKELRQNSSKQQVDFEKLLERENFSNRIERMNGSEKVFSGVRFNHIEFAQCDFISAEIDQSLFQDCKFHQADFTNATLRDTAFDRCLLHQSRWAQAIFQRTFFSHCSMPDAVFYRSQLDQVRFSHVNLERSSFNDSSLDNVFWDRCNLQESNFLSASVHNSSIQDSNLNNAAVCEAEDRIQFIGKNDREKTKPVVSITWEFIEEKNFAKIICEKLRKQGAMVLKYEGTPEGIDSDKLSTELQEGLKRISEQGLGDSPSIGQWLHSHAEPGSQMAALQAKAAAIHRFCDSILIPGGVDIEPELYGAAREEHTYTEGTPGKSLLELALIGEGVRSNRRIMGICRGSQMINVYYGGTLQQHIRGQRGVLQVLEPVNSEALSKENIVAYSSHHQCVDRLGEGLELLYKNEEGVPKAWISKDGRVLGTQFHPELYDEIATYSKHLKNALNNKAIPEEKIPYVRTFASNMRQSADFFSDLFHRLYV